MIKKTVILFTTTILLFLAPVLSTGEVTYTDPNGNKVTWDGKLRWNPHYAKNYKKRMGKNPQICVDVHRVRNPNYKKTGGPEVYVYSVKLVLPGLSIDFTKGLVNDKYVLCTDEELKIYSIETYKYYPGSVLLYFPNKTRGVPEVNRLYGITYDKNGWVLSWTRREKKDPSVRRLLEQRRKQRSKK